jgi:hypothetical protein
VTELTGDDLHPTGDFLPQAGLVLTFGATVAVGRPLGTTEVVGLVGRARLTLGAGDFLFGCYRLCFGLGIL